MIRKIIGLIFLIGVIAVVISCSIQFCGFKQASDLPKIEDAPYIAETLSQIYPCRSFDGTLEKPTAINDYWYQANGHWKFVPGKWEFHKRFGPVRIIRR